jgi:very-short-patch-repair endonuclease
MADEIARGLRKRMTQQEVKLWVHLRSLEKAGIPLSPPAKARSRASATRYAPRDDFIVDFICIKHRLVVEVDGGQHNFDTHARRDAKRDNHFISQGFRVLRFWNNEIDRNLEGVRCSASPTRWSSDRRSVGTRASATSLHAFRRVSTAVDASALV